jgi:hypothetical protein
VLPLVLLGGGALFLLASASKSNSQTGSGTDPLTSLLNGLGIGSQQQAGPSSMGANAGSAGGAYGNIGGGPSGSNYGNGAADSGYAGAGSDTQLGNTNDLGTNPGGSEGSDLGSDPLGVASSGGDDTTVGGLGTDPLGVGF